MSLDEVPPHRMVQVDVSLVAFRELAALMLDPELELFSVKTYVVPGDRLWLMRAEAEEVLGQAYEVFGPALDSTDPCPEWQCPDLSAHDRREGRTCPDHPCTCEDERDFLGDGAAAPAYGSTRAPSPDPDPRRDPRNDR